MFKSEQIIFYLNIFYLKNKNKQKIKINIYFNKQNIRILFFIIYETFLNIVIKKIKHLIIEIAHLIAICFECILLLLLLTDDLLLLFN
jgi:hypothetical protein